MGDSMTPEFEDGAIIIVDPAAPCENGAYAVIEHNGEIIFRQYVTKDDKKFLRPLNDDYDTVALIGQYEVRGVVIQKSYKRKRKHYDWSPKFTA
jgi:SOS-response transcriptional repressor LexA